MNIRNFISLALFALATMLSSAANRTVSEATSIAKKFIADRTGHLNVDLALRLVHPTRADINELPYYIFNDKESAGFVIVSGSDKMREVIGYSTTTCIPENEELPDNLRSWLQLVSETAEYLELHPETASVNAELQFATTAIEPLMKSKWNQNPLYNKFCPPASVLSTQRCPTGCVATAAAQVVRYHLAKSGEVITGKGSKSYMHNGVNLSVNFAENTYDYTKMPLSLSDKSTEEEIDEVAKLSYHIGVGIHMDYSPSGSGAFSAVLPTTLIENFGFNRNYRQTYRDMYDFSEWNALLLNELQNGRPIIYSGSSSTGGHCFVLEGVDSNGMYYVNWGWGGQSDGYFDINILRPSSVGTGASLSPDGYISQCTASVNLCLEDGVGERPSPLTLYSDDVSFNVNTLSCGDQLYIKGIGFLNFDPYNNSGDVGYALYGESGIVDSSPMTQVENLEGVNADNGTYGYIQGNFLYQIPQDLADGDYRLYFTYKGTGEEELLVMRGRYPFLSYILLKVKDGKVEVSLPKYETKVSASEWNVESETVIAETPTTISVIVSNNSEQSFVGKYFLTLVSSIGVKAATFESKEVPALAAGESAKVTFDVTFPTASTWTVQLTTKRQGVGDAVYEDVEDGTYSFSVSPNPMQNANFEMTEALQVLAEGPVSPNEKFKVRMVVNNCGDDYEGEFGLQFFSSILMRDPKAEVYAPVTLPASHSGAIEVELTMPELRSGTTYYVRGAYRKGSAYEPFTVKVSGVLNRSTIVVGATALDGITSPDAGMPSVIYDIYGRPATKLQNGVMYINKGKLIVK